MCHEVTSGFFATNTTNQPHWTLNSCFGVFQTIWVQLGQFGCLTNLGGKRAELVQKFVPRSRIGMFRNECTRSSPLEAKLLFWYVSYHLAAFVLFGCIKKLGGKRAQLVQKFVPRSRIGIFCNEHTRSTPWDPKLIFWYISYYLVAFGIVLLPYGIQCKTGRTSAKFRDTKSLRNFSQRTHPINPIGP